MADFDPPQETEPEVPPPPQEKRIGYLALAFLIGLAIPSVILPLAIPARIRANIQADAVKSGHAVYKVTDEFGHTKFEWVPIPGMPAPDKK